MFLAVAVFNKRLLVRDEGTIATQGLMMDLYDGEFLDISLLYHYAGKAGKVSLML